MPTHLPTPDYPRFHLAFPVTDLDEARRFHRGFLGCGEGRSSEDWVDFDFFGHQIGNAIEIKAFADMDRLFAQ